MFGISWYGIVVAALKGVKHVAPQTTKKTIHLSGTKMEAVRSGLEVFKESLPTALAGYWVELLVGSLATQLLLFLCEFRDVLHA
jgi:hypothetical protein